MVLFAGACSLLAFVVRMRPIARQKAKVLYIRIDNADGGRAKMKSHPTRKAGATDICKPHQKWAEGTRKAVYRSTARAPNGRRALARHCEISSRERRSQRRGIA